MRISMLAGPTLIAGIVCGLALIGQPPKDTIFSLAPGELQLINQRRSYYSNQVIGKLLENKITVYVSHYVTNLSYGLDPNFYFFASHPRERAGYPEYLRLPLWLLPFFLVGLVRQLSKRALAPTVYFLVSLGVIAFFKPFDTYAFVLYPFIILSACTWLID